MVGHSKAALDDYMVDEQRRALVRASGDHDDKHDQRTSFFQLSSTAFFQHVANIQRSVGSAAHAAIDNDAGTVLFLDLPNKEADPLLTRRVPRVNPWHPRI